MASWIAKSTSQTSYTGCFRKNNAVKKWQNKPNKPWLLYCDIINFHRFSNLLEFVWYNIGIITSLWHSLCIPFFSEHRVAILLHLCAHIICNKYVQFLIINRITNYKKQIRMSPLHKVQSAKFDHRNK